MFTGIIADVGEVCAVTPGADTGFTIATRLDLSDLVLGASVACSGVCLTVVDKGEAWFAVQVSAETRARSTLDGWDIGTRVNLERAMKLGEELGGHLVTGHVDAVARIVGREAAGDSIHLTVEVPAALQRAIASKGSVALDGTSLTVNEVQDNRFGVNLIPHTLANTTFGKIEIGDRVNLEIDLIARYVARLLGGSGGLD